MLARIGRVNQKGLDGEWRQISAQARAYADRATQQVRSREAGTQLRRQHRLHVRRQHMKVFGCWVATERHQVWLANPGAAARPDRAVGRACPASIGVVGRADRERIHAIRWNLYAVVAELAVPVSVIANGHRHERVAVAEQLVDNGPEPAR
ncbi:hypothetical protein G6F22_019319 [Rhizopus arrhizus]|nr:hypothetical protein G6F22_019319 [Rhizopus arrhizus]